MEPSENQRNNWNSEVFSYANTYLNQVDTAKAFYQSEKNEESFSEMDITEESTEISILLESTSKNIDHHGLTQGSGGHMGYIPGGGLYPSALGDYIAAITNHYSGVFYASPGSVR